MRLVTRLDPRLTPWLWGVNGASGVLAAGVAVACSIGFSIDVTVRVGGVCYYALLLLFALPFSMPFQLATEPTEDDGPEDRGYHGEHDAIIDERLWNEAQSINREPARTRGTRGRYRPFRHRHRQS